MATLSINEPAKPARSGPGGGVEHCRGTAEICWIGASVRAAAFSAVRAGFSPHASDLFGDEDLRAAAEFHGIVSPYPAGFESALGRMPQAPFAYTGGLENHPDLIDRLATIRPLWGNAGATLRLARDPISFAIEMRAAGANPPETRKWDDPPASLRGWLVKPTQSAGGRGIRVASSAQRPGAILPRSAYFQRRARGVSCSAVYVATKTGCEWIGATRQLVGEAWLHAKPYAWCGNIGPLELPVRVESTLVACGERATRAFALRGVFGIDFLLDGNEVQPVEINPRYPASVEILELTLGHSILALHARAFGSQAKAPRGSSLDCVLLGKAVVHAPSTIRIPEGFQVSTARSCFEPPGAADIPAAGTVVKRGHPILTLFASGNVEVDVIQALRTSAAGLLANVIENEA